MEGEFISVPNEIQPRAEATTIYVLETVVRKYECLDINEFDITDEDTYGVDLGVVHTEKRLEKTL